MAAEPEQCFAYVGGGHTAVPDTATHVSIDPSVKVIPASLFYDHPNLVELICHDGVERIEECAFYRCPRLKRVTARGALVFERCVFYGCESLLSVECRKLETIEEGAFYDCESLESIHLPSLKIAGRLAFHGCRALKEANFGSELESIKGLAFYDCRTLERLTLPLKHGFINDDIFQGCRNLKRVDLVEVGKLRATIDALVLEEWKTDMNQAIDSIKQTLPNAPAGKVSSRNFGYKALAIEGWITRILLKITRYVERHRSLLKEATLSLQLAFPNDVVTDKVLPFLELPPHCRLGGGEEDEKTCSFEVEDNSDESYYSSEDEEEDSVGGGRLGLKAAIYARILAIWGRRTR